MLNRILIIICLLLILIGCSGQKKDQQKITGLKEQVNNRLSDVQGDFAVAFKLLGDNSEVLFLHEQEVFHAASTMKTPVMIELYKQVEEGKFKLDDSVQVINSFKSIVDGSPFSMDINVDSQEGLYDKIGQRVTYRELNYQMITKSSNLATNILIDHLGAKQVTQTMRDLGAMNIQVLRGVEDLKAFEQGLSNTTTALDLLLIMESIANGQAVSKEASAEMFEILRDQHFNEIIPAFLPENVIVAHKTGSITGVRHDSGIVRLPDGKEYVLVLLSKNLTSLESGVRAMAEVSRMVYNYVENKE